MKKRSFLFVGLLLALTAGIFAACNKQKCEVHEYGEGQTVTAATRTELLDSGDIHCVLATFTITDERKESWDLI